MNSPDHYRLLKTPIPWRTAALRSSSAVPQRGLEDEGGLMAKAEEVWTQLATRIPKELHRRLKLHCVTHDIAVMHFVVEAIEGSSDGSKRRRPRPDRDASRLAVSEARCLR